VIAPEFPESGFPSGWFQVAWSDEIAPCDVRPLQYFGEDLVLYRTASGRAQLLDGHCAHMGAHLGYGGCVEGDCVVCPFHGWAWGPDGRNTMVPSTGAPTTRRRLRSWPTEVSNGIIWVWHDSLGRDPLWDFPADRAGVAERERHSVFPACCRKFPGIRMRPQYVPENNVDLEHLRWIHRAEGPIEFDSLGEDGYCFRTAVRMVYGFGKERTRLTPEGPIEVTVTAEIWGLGYQFTYFPEPDNAISIQCQTPIDSDHCDMFQSVLVYREPGASEGEPTAMAAARVREQLVQIERDIPIWEHMRYLPNAALTRNEAKPVTAIRRWAKQFYPVKSG
jgi:phenylpropionate dioxygenase-like ring-hydroxylating dioxygenase large terminal subunit